MGEVGPHRAGEDVWKEQKGERIYACHAKKTEKTQDDEIQGWGGIKLGIDPHDKQW